ncbi:MAG: 16S rRNA (uracil(1498)-N(3))-methyltransferase [Gammaproteobacteria bacterium]|nr:16S rRNA (uracil(1498)-N(3))-methyltransferase [Gammaproteobacteria bacterium]MBU1443949.1 16S rRNA (uracil(1498)-N(3))-methyltransferase [Gammaproteobacteria bacterium]
MNPRFHCSVPLQAATDIDLPASAARHVQVLRMQPGDAVTLFDGRGGEFEATVLRMGRSDVAVQVGMHRAIERESRHALHLAVGMPANERMDWLVEKATELGVLSIQPLQTARSVVRLSGERAEKKRAHWEAIAIAACEQCGRNRVPTIHPVRTLAQWIGPPGAGTRGLVLSLADDASAVTEIRAPSAGQDGASVVMLSGPEGGLTSSEEVDAIAHGFAPVSLGPRILRAETAAIAALALLAG